MILLLKTLRGFFFIMKTTFTYFPGMFENPAPAKYYLKNEIKNIMKMRRKIIMTIVCNIWMIYLELNLLFYDPSRMLQLSEFVWTLRFSVWVVFNHFLLLNATNRSKICSYQKLLFIAVSLYPLSRTVPLKKKRSIC